MSLTFDTTKIEDKSILTRKGIAELHEIPEIDYWTPAVQTMSFLTITTGINPITKENWEEFYIRAKMGYTALGIDHDHITPQLVRSFVGLSTNASTISRAQFNKNVCENLHAWFETQIRKELSK